MQPNRIMKPSVASTPSRIRPQLLNSAAALESLGNPTRLSIFRLLVKAGPRGLPVGDIQRSLSIPASTLSHHLAHLVQNDLIRQQREGRVLRCLPNFQRMNELLSFLTDECCRESGGDCRPAR